jgi:hypothetical protein
VRIFLVCTEHGHLLHTIWNAREAVQILKKQTKGKARDTPAGRRQKK